MSAFSKPTILALYGLAVVASGLMRYFGAEGGEKGLWFGVVMGAVALLGAALMRSGRTRLGLGLAALALAFVGGWFTYEALVKKGLAEAETRQLVVLAATVVSALLLLRRPDDHSSRAGTDLGPERA